jgi:hypothetical protein
VKPCGKMSFIHSSTRILAAEAEIVAKHARDRRVGQPTDVLAPPNMMVCIDRRPVVWRQGIPPIIVVTLPASDHAA